MPGVVCLVLSLVWSYAVFLMEVYQMGVIPYQHLTNEEVILYVQMGRRMPRPDHCTLLLVLLIAFTW